MRSIGLTCYATMAFSDMPPERMRDANTLMATNQQLAGGMGIAAAAVLLRVGGPLSGALPGHPGAARAVHGRVRAAGADAR